MVTPVEQWLLQAEYDLHVAEDMLASGRFSYAIFMSNLAIEKALKGLFTKVHKQQAPKTHNLLFLLSESRTIAPEEIGKFLSTLNALGTTTRYPEDILALQKLFSNEELTKMIESSWKTLQWIKTLLPQS